MERKFAMYGRCRRSHAALVASLPHVATDSFDRGVIAKVERALALRDQLQAEQERLRSRAGETREYESSTNKKDCEDPVVWMEWRLKESVPPIPPSFAALLGDCIQNLRASLDYAAWAAAAEEARQTKSTQIMFPLYDDVADYRNWAKKRAGWFNDDVFKVLDWAQPFRAGEGLLHPLRVLRVLSNTDKHRLLNVVEHAHIDAGLQLDPMPPAHTWWTASGPVAVGEPLAKLSFPRPPFSLGLDVRPSFGWYESVAYEAPGEAVTWLRLDEMMNAMCDFAVRTVSHMSGARLGLKDDAESDA